MSRRKEEAPSVATRFFYDAEDGSKQSLASQWVQEGELSPSVAGLTVDPMDRGRGGGEGLIQCAAPAQAENQTTHNPTRFMQAQARVRYVVPQYGTVGFNTAQYGSVPYSTARR